MLPTCITHVEEVCYSKRICVVDMRAAWSYILTDRLSSFGLGKHTINKETLMQIVQHSFTSEIACSFNHISSLFCFAPFPLSIDLTWFVPALTNPCFCTKIVCNTRESAYFSPCSHKGRVLDLLSPKVVAL